MMKDEQALPDLSGILVPLPGAAPTGVSLIYDPVYDAIREARREDDATLPQGVWQTAPKRADWEGVIRLCLEVLEHRSKDTQVACWLAEALVQRYGAVALAPGLRMLGGLCVTFWHALHPMSENGEPPPRLVPLEWLDKRLAHVVGMMPVTSTEHGERYSLADYQNAQRLGIAATRDARVAENARACGERLPDDIEDAASATPTPVLRQSAEHLSRAITEIAALSAQLHEICGNRAPGLTTLRTRLVEVQAWIHAILYARDAMPALPGRGSAEGAGAVDDDDDTLVEGAEDEEGWSPPDREAAPSVGPIRNRLEAYRRLSEAAEYLMRTEPHSPTPYLLRRALSWRDMPLHEVLMELSGGRNDLTSVFDLLGFSLSESNQRSARR